MLDFFINIETFDIYYAYLIVILNFASVMVSENNPMRNNCI